MKQIIALLLITITIMLSACTTTSSIEQTQENQDINQNIIIVEKSLNQTLFEITMQNSDAKEYLNSHPNAKLIKMETFYPNEKLNNTDFPNEYKNLENKQYYELTIGDNSDLKLISIIDLENNKTTSVFGLFLIGISS